MRAREDGTGRTMALKKVKTDLTAEREGFPITALREIQILKQPRAAPARPARGGLEAQARAREHRGAE